MIKKMLFIEVTHIFKRFLYNHNRHGVGSLSKIHVLRHEEKKVLLKINTKL